MKNPSLFGVKMFIQCVEDDLTRCLKPGTVVLYKVMLLLSKILATIIIAIYNNVISQKHRTSS